MPTELWELARQKAKESDRSIASLIRESIREKVNNEGRGKQSKSYGLETSDNLI